MTPEQHVRGVAHNAVQQALHERGHWLPLTDRQAIADAVIAALPEHGLAVVRRADLDLVMNGAGDATRTTDYPAACQRIQDALEGGQRG